MIDLKSLGLQPGQKLRLKTEDEIVIGLFKKLSTDGLRIEIENIQRLDGSKLGKSRWYHNESIKEIKAENLEGIAERATNEISRKLFNPTIVKAQSDRINRMMQEVTYINQANASYYEALTDISESLFIGLYAENSDMGRFLKAEFLQIATTSKVYVYDLLQLNTTRLFDDLRPILECEAYLKIVYDSRLLLDNLNKHFELKIAPICDLVLNMNNETTFKDYGQCVQEVFGIKLDSQQKDILRRPVDREQLMTLSSKVAFLIPLYAQMNQLKLLETYGQDIQEYTSVSEKDLFKDLFLNNREKLKKMIKKRRETESSKE